MDAREKCSGFVPGELVAKLCRGGWMLRQPKGTCPTLLTPRILWSSGDRWKNGVEPICEHSQFCKSFGLYAKPAFAKFASACNPGSSRRSSCLEPPPHCTHWPRGLCAHKPHLFSQSYRWLSAQKYRKSGHFGSIPEITLDFVFTWNPLNPGSATDCSGVYVHSTDGQTRRREGVWQHKYTCVNSNVRGMLTARFTQEVTGPISYWLFRLPFSH